MKIRALIMALTAALTVGFGQLAVAQPAAPAAAGQPSKEGYILGQDDVVEVEVVGRNDFKARAKVGTDGTIPLPYIGNVQAANKTTLQLAEDVRAALEKGGYFTKPIMRVDVVSFASRYVTVLGAVANPGLVPVDRTYRLSEVLARVGGVRENAADYVSVRAEAGSEKRVPIKTLATGNAEQDPVVSPGDKIYIPAAEIFYISGQVRAPGSYPLASDMTLRMAVAKAGGLTELGSQRGIQITRTDGKVQKVGMDAKVMPGDVIVVRERFF